MRNEDVATGAQGVREELGDKLAVGVRRVFVVEFAEQRLEFGVGSQCLIEFGVEQLLIKGAARQASTVVLCVRTVVAKASGLPA